MKRNFFEPFINQKVAVGVHHYSEDRPFYYYGILIELGDTYLILQFGTTGIKQINFSDILDIHLDKNKKHYGGF